MPRLLSALLILALAAGCAAPEVFVAEGHRGWRDSRPPPEETYRVVLLGDGGHAPADTAVLNLLRTYLADVGERGAVVFLGDNAHPAGLPDSAAATRAEAEARLRAQLDAVRDFPGRIVVLPGEQDWSADGRAALARQEAFVEEYLGRGDTFLPGDGFPGPTAVELADGVTLIALDTQWWLADDRPTGDAGDYTLREPSDFLLELEDLLYRYRDGRILIAGHHPLLSNGPHAGRVPWTAHLTPLPLLGSVGPLYRRFVGREQDLAHADYRLLRRELRTLFAGRDGLVYAAGHDRSLQYFPVVERRRQLHYLVSGSAAGAEHVAAGHGAVFTAQRPGFLALRYFADRSVWLEAWTPGQGEGRLLFREQIEEAEPDPAPEPAVTASDGLPDFRDSTIVQAVEPGYAQGGLRNLLLGRHHRPLWATPVEVPVLDAAHTAGGLTPIKVGGQSQSVTMRLEGGDGKIYMLRSIDKVAGRNWPPALRRTVAKSLAQNQIAMLHPFGALLMPALSDAAGVYHTNPRLVYVPDDPRLGPQRDALVGEVVLFEIRPDEDLSDLDYVGNASNVIGSTKLFDAITDDNDHRVDARAFARARLLDMLVADWDRTADNFRWSAFEPYERDPSLEGDARTEGKIYVPVPRDRDAAFTRIDGLLPRLYQRLVERVWQDFDADYGYLKGLNRKGLPLDRRFTAALTRDDWVGLAEDLQERLTDDVLARAVAAWPAPVRAQAGAETIRILQARRARLPEVAAKHYALLARVVDVVGSDKHERFEVTRQADGGTDVVVFKTSKKGETRKELYRRTFRPGETREIRLYGLGGRDRFEVGGEGRSGIRLVAVGGPGDDAFAVQDPAGRTRFYDAPAGTHVETAEGVDVRLRADPLVNRYDLDGYQPNQTQPVAFFGSNTDDGVFVGGGVKITRHGFRKAPHAQTHRIRGNYAVKTNAFNLRYAGHFVDVAGAWDLHLDAAAFNRNTIRNFYGLGNETEDDDRDAEFYQARFGRATVAPRLALDLARGVEIAFGPAFEFIDVREDEDRFVTVPQPGITENTFGQLVYGAAEAALTLQSIDHAPNPRQGFRWRTTADAHLNLEDRSDAYLTLASDLAFYASPSLTPQLTVAARAGGEHIAGTFPFFDAATLGGKDNLRGYRSTRFAGRTSAYQNLDVRVEVFDFGGYLGYGEAGVLGFLDNGRVWTDGEGSRTWHQGYGGGLWAHLFDAATLTATYALSPEDRTVTIQLGFQF